MQFAILASLFAVDSMQIPVDKGRSLKDFAPSSITLNESDSIFLNSLGILEDMPGRELPHNGTVLETPDWNLVALSCALTLLGAYLLFMILYFLYTSIRSSGRAYVRLDAERGRDIWEGTKEQVSDKATGAARGIVQSVEKGKEKLKHASHGKPVLYQPK